ncbi:hypothetical protein GCM10027160_07270 [Streptomyces calidiresistens]
MSYVLAIGYRHTLGPRRQNAHTLAAPLPAHAGEIRPVGEHENARALVPLPDREAATASRPHC